MPQPLQRVVILGAGTMGARIAAHCANHGLEVHLLDLTKAQAKAGAQAAEQSRPASFFLPAMARRIQTGSFADSSTALKNADWVVEAVIEDLAAKHQLLAQIVPHLGPATVLTTNTSGLPVHAVGAVLPTEVRRRWWGTHFFNPPRYMRLVEVIPTLESDPEQVKWLSGALEERLGKGVVIANDTPNFIANRLGVFGLLNTLRLMQELGLTIEQVDALTGPLLGWPKSATFRTLDMIGLDTLASVVRNSYDNLPEDEQRELFRVPNFIEDMLQRGWLGEKSGQGFYKREGDAILALDLESMTYHPRRKTRLPFDDLAGGLHARGEVGGKFLSQALEGLFAYAEARIGEISDDRGAVDRAMRWGYNWQFGPFELQKLASTGKAPVRPLGKTMRANPGCSLLDLGDGVGCLEFHTKLNVIGADTVAMVSETLGGGAAATSGSEFEAYVISNGGENFSAGADLLYLLAAIQNDDWDEVELAVRHFQAMTAAVKYSPRPVVVAPFGLTLGGGCELMLHAARVVAHAELYTGLVEVGVGLIPAGGGTKELALRMDPKTALETIALAKVSTSAAEARQLGLLLRGDETVANRERVLEAAKQTARHLAGAGYEPPAVATYLAPGPSVESTLQLGVFLMREADQISEHEEKIGRHLIRVICAGGAPAGMAVSEDRMLELEREAFLSLCGEAKTQERIGHMLKTGKVLRN